MRKSIFTTATKRHRGRSNTFRMFSVSILCFLCASVPLWLISRPGNGHQLPGPPRSGQIPPVHDKKLANGLTVAVGERHAIPLVTIQFLVKSASLETKTSLMQASRT